MGSKTVGTALDGVNLSGQRLLKFFLLNILSKKKDILLLLLLLLLLKLSLLRLERIVLWSMKRISYRTKSIDRSSQPGCVLVAPKRRKRDCSCNAQYLGTDVINGNSALWSWVNSHIKHLKHAISTLTVTSYSKWSVLNANCVYFRGIPGHIRYNCIR